MAWASMVAKVMECSDDAWEINTTFTPKFSSVENMRLATPGTPMSPDPSTFKRAMSSMEENPQTHFSVSVFVVDSFHMRDPRNFGLKVFRIMIGIGGLLEMAGCIVLGWITLAPKYANSMASL